MITCGYQNVVKFIHLIYKEGEHNKCYVNECFLKVFKTSIKLLAIPFLVMILTCFIQRALKGNWPLKGNLGT